MSEPAILSVRLPPDVRRALRERAVARRSTLSAEVVRALRATLQIVPGTATDSGRTGRSRRRILGALPGSEAPERDELARLRRGFAARLSRTRSRVR